MSGSALGLSILRNYELNKPLSFSTTEPGNFWTTKTGKDNLQGREQTVPATMHGIKSMRKEVT